MSLLYTGQNERFWLFVRFQCGGQEVSLARFGVALFPKLAVRRRIPVGALATEDSEGAVRASGSDSDICILLLQAPEQMSESKDH
jgi:hypothetical protein